MEIADLNEVGKYSVTVANCTNEERNGSAAVLKTGDVNESMETTALLVHTASPHSNKDTALSIIRIRVETKMDFRFSRKAKLSRNFASRKFSFSQQLS
jgi:hypothetical protein